jgi:heptosyltransferase-2
MTVHAERRLGVGLSRYGTPFPLNEAADYYFELGLNNQEKFHANIRSYQQLIYEALGMTYEGQRLELELTEADRAAAASRLGEIGASGEPGRRIGINPGAGGVFAYKAWREGGYVELIRRLSSELPGAQFLLLGGREESALLMRMIESLDGLPVFSAGTDNDLGTFAALIGRCDLLVCGDTLAMHLAIALRREVVAMFGPTCEQEIDLFGRGVKIKSPIGCSPCYRRTCDLTPTCQDLIDVQSVFDAVISRLDTLENDLKLKPTNEA